MEKALILISSSRELYWYCARKLSCRVLHYDFPSFFEFALSESSEAVSCVILDVRGLDGEVILQVRNMVSVRMDCMFFTVDSEDSEIPSGLSHMAGSPDAMEGEPRDFFVAEGFGKGVRDFRKSMERFSSIDEPVLLLGESGCGKTYSARMIHDLSPRCNHPFVSRNIAELNPLLIESELFGTVRGAYTDAPDRKGLFEEAGCGTLFLDEIGELSFENQAKILGVLDSGEFCRVGSTKKIKVRCRLIFATDCDLKVLAEENKFKKQLYWRLEKFVVHIPPLRERRNEIRVLSQEFAREAGKELSEDAVAFLERLDWPGNIRQLMFCIQRSALLCDGKRMEKKNLLL